MMVLEGNIASGKTTLATKLQQSFQQDSKAADVPLFVPEPMIDEFLALMYAEPAKYALSFQLTMLIARFKDLLSCTQTLRYRPRSIVAAVPSPAASADWVMVDDGTKVYRPSWSAVAKGSIGKASSLALSAPALRIMVDRGLWGDTVFARAQHHLSHMQAFEMEIYLSTFTKLCKQVSGAADIYGQVMVYLDVPPSICLERVHNMRKRDGEQRITLEYLTLLDRIYFELLVACFSSNGSPVLSATPHAPKTSFKATSLVVVDWSAFGQTDRVLDAVNQALRGKPTQSQIRWDLKKSIWSPPRSTKAQVISTLQTLQAFEPRRGVTELWMKWSLHSSSELFRRVAFRTMARGQPLIFF